MMMTQETEKSENKCRSYVSMILFHRIIFCGLSIKQLTGHLFMTLFVILILMAWDVRALTL